MTKPIRVLHFQGRMGKGGAETFIMNTYRNIDRSQLQFDFLIYHDFKDIKPYNKEIEKLGGRIFSVPNPKKNIFGYVLAVQKLLRDEYFDIAHNHVFFGGGLNLWLAHKAGIQKRIAHSHATTDGKNTLFSTVIRKGLDKWMFKYGTDFLACSTEAGIGLFGEDHPFKFIPNGINLNLFQNKRETKRESKKRIGVPEESFVIGNIGRFELQKNHDLLIDIFKNVTIDKPDSSLILIGEGSLEEDLKLKVNQLQLNEKVYFLGIREDIPDILNAMDVMVMPSLYEGLPISAVEAQASGVKLVMSSEVSKETQLSQNVKFLSLETSLDVWVDTILKEPMDNRPLPEMKKFDVEFTAELMQGIYLDEVRT